MTLDLPECVLPVPGDHDHIMQVMLNLISNAVKFCDSQQGRIHIALKQETDHLRVSVSDNGIGIRPEDQGIIFETFRQVKDTGKGRPAGSGLGLAITKRIIDFHKGRIWVESEPGRGATFIFTLPLQRTAPTTSRDIKV